MAGQARAFPPPPVRARAALVMDAASGTVLYGKNAHLHLPMASTTKVMTALVALQSGHLDDRITVPAAAFNFESDATVMGLHAGQVVTLRDLLYGLLLPSGADAANTIAIHYGGSEAHFASMMNHTASLLGMHDTHYVNAHGLTASNHYTSAYDLAVLAQYVSYIADLSKIVSTRTYSWNGHTLTNLNRVLFWYPGLDGVKPGYTNDAGICQVLDARRHGRHVVVVLLNTPDLVVDARNLLNFGLSDFTWAQSTATGDSPGIILTGSDTGGQYVYFPGSGHFVRGKFWTSYAGNGGFDTLGFPRTESIRVGASQIQYFQNGALSLDASSGRMQRLAVGLTPVPTPKPSPTVPPMPTVTPTPHEGTVHPGSVTPTPTPVARKTGTPRATATPHPQPSPTVVLRPQQPAGVFSSFWKTHQRTLGSAVSAPLTQHGYRVQIFTYGALLYDARTRTIYLLPVMDRLLAARHYLPAYPGTAYPRTFAPASILNALGWLPTH